MIKAVIDTNILVSGLINTNGNPAKIINMILNSDINVIYDSRIIEEYYNVLKRDKFSFSGDLIVPLLEFIQNEGISVTPGPVKLKFHDTDDTKFYEAALAGEADFLITGNKKHYPKEKFIVNPAEFLDFCF